MNHKFASWVVLLSSLAVCGSAYGEQEATSAASLKVGVIGVDTSHAINFTRILNDPKAPPELSNCRVVAAYPKGSRDIESSVSRVPQNTERIKELGVEIVDSVDALIERVDVVLLESNDGKPHLEQALPVLKAGKRMFIDKPIAASLTDAIAIFEASKRYKTPVFSSSSLRYAENAQAIRNGSIGDVVGCDTYSPASREPSHPDFFWYGIHGVEALFTVMGAGCETVTRVHTPSMDVAVGKWKDGRIGVFRSTPEIRLRPSYGGVAYGTKGVQPVGSHVGYEPLVADIVKFFRTGVAPVSPEETLEIYAFMEAADESKRRNGAPVSMASMLEKARRAAAEKSLD